ncbi:MAG: MFS transporter, partial [Myxococcales bacterium]
MPGAIVALPDLRHVQGLVIVERRALTNAADLLASRHSKRRERKGERGCDVGRLGLLRTGSKAKSQEEHRGRCAHDGTIPRIASVGKVQRVTTRWAWDPAGAPVAWLSRGATVPSPVMSRAQNAAPPEPRARWALTVLLLAYILSFIDRNVMAILVGPIRKSFEINDFEYGLLHGLAFTVFYTLLGLPIGRLADRRSRRTIVGLGVMFWSVMTCACGLVRSLGG